VLASIDVGSNTVRLLLGELTPGGVEPFLYERRITRLKGGQADNALLTPEAMARTGEALHDFAVLLDRHRPVACRVVGTAALRQAGNAGQFLQQTKERTGLAVEIISGEEEARLSALGVSAALEPAPSDNLIVDVGGGSTEFVLLKHRAVLFQESIPLGVVALAESGWSDSACLEQIDRQVASVLDRLVKTTGLSLTDCRLVGTAGTATTLAAMHLQMQVYDWRRVNNHRLTADDLNRMRVLLLGLSVEQREALPGMEVGRGDLILPGIGIFQALMRRLDTALLTVSDFGLLEGTLVDLGTRIRRAEN